jgi:hypothetical protein
MTIALCYLKVEAFETIPDVIPKLPEAIRPTHFGEGEGPNEPRFPLASVGARVALKELGRSGYLLFGDQLVYMVTHFRYGYSELFVSSEEEEELPIGGELVELMRALTRHGLEFGFVAEEEEYLHRNQHTYRLPHGRVESWVGRDLSRYLPGLYWTTAFSRVIAQKYGVEAETLPAGARALDFGPEHLGFRLFDVPKDWPRHAEQIDAYCEQRPKIFSLQRVRGPLDRASNHLELTRRLRDWE